MKRGFTLLELLIVVLIIGVLAAVAVPQYQRAVLKSRFAALMPIAKSMADSNEVYYLEHGFYADTPQELTVTVQENYPDGTTVEFSADREDVSFVQVGGSNISNARYVVYQKHSKNFPDTTWCEAGDERAEEVCQALGGVIPNGVTGNSSGIGDWKAYLLSGMVRNGDKFTMTGWTAEMLQALADEKCVGADSCTQDMDKGTVTATKCGVWKDMPQPTTSGSGSTRSVSACQNTTYDTKGNESSTYTACGDRYAGGNPKTGCYPTQDCRGSGSTCYAYERTVGDDGSVTGAKFCYTYSGGCTFAKQADSIFDENGQRIGLNYVGSQCASGTVDLATFTCAGGYVSRAVSDATGTGQNSISCTGTVSSTGECNGSWKYEHRPYNDYWYNAGRGFVDDSAICENGVDWETATCK